MARNQASTHWVGDDCPGGHREPAFPPNVCRCGHSINYHRLRNDQHIECFAGAPPCRCEQYRATP
jgi:hypothetical protein